jgi:hypothetical protein
MRDREILVSNRALILLVDPEVFAMHGIESREDPLRSVITEEHVVMQVLGVGLRRPFEGDQRRELAGRVMFVGSIDLFLPGGLHDLGVHEIIDRLVDGCRGDDLLERLLALLVVTAGDQLADLGLLQRALRVQQQRHHAQVFGMVGYRSPVIGRPLLDHLAGLGVLDGLALGETVGVVGGVAGAECEGIGRCLGVQVLLAEVDVVQRVGLLRAPPGLARRIRCPSNRGIEHHGQCESANPSPVECHSSSHF